MTCPNCSYENGDNAQICTRCGELLVMPSSTAIIPEEQQESEGSPKYGSVRFGISLILEVVDGKSYFEFDRDELQELIIGRKDPETGVLPRVDLSADNAMEKGVSRNHAMIVRREGALHIRDNDSANGTFLNGQRLIEDKLRVLRDGDDIRVGKIVLRVTFA